MRSGGLTKFLVLGSWFVVAGGGVGCGDAADESSEPSLYASEVVSFDPGKGAGWGQHYLPDNVLGEPDGAYSSSPAAERHWVLSLGAGGEVVLGFDRPIVDGPGADFVVFENSFWIRDNPDEVWAELGEVSVSEDGETWHTFECSKEPTKPGRWPGCAGWTPTKSYDPQAVVPLDPEVTGGDAFDLADLGLADLGVERVRYVRIRDMLDNTNSQAENVGFDLDAVGVVHAE